VSPERTDLVLTANIPHSEADVLVFNSFYIKTCSSAENKYSSTTP